MQRLPPPGFFPVLCPSEFPQQLQSPRARTFFVFRLRYPPSPELLEPALRQRARLWRGVSVTTIAPTQTTATTQFDSPNAAIRPCTRVRACVGVVPPRRHPRPKHATARKRGNAAACPSRRRVHSCQVSPFRHRSPPPSAPPPAPPSPPPPSTTRRGRALRRAWRARQSLHRRAPPRCARAGWR